MDTPQANRPQYATGRQRMEAAFSAAGSPAVAAVICYEGIYVRDHWSQLTDQPWWYAHSPEIEHQIAWRRDVIERTGQDWFFLPMFLPAAQRRNLSIRIEGNDVCRVDRASGLAEPLEPPQVGGSGHVARSVKPENPPRTAAAVDAAIPIPDCHNPQEVVRDGRGDLAAQLLGEFGEQLWPICHVISPLWGCYRLWGFEGLMTLLADEPGLVRRACQRYLVLAERQILEAAAIGTAGVWIEECFTDLVSPQVFETTNLPLVVRLVETIRGAGMKSIYYYCGSPASRWDLILSARADALSFEESKKNFVIDIDEIVARTQGQCTVLGNLDAVGVLQDGDEGELRREIGRQVAAGRRNGGRFVMSLGSPVTPGTPVARVRRYCELAREAAGGP